MKTDFLTVEEYINTFPENIREILEKIRGVILKVAPNAEESISYSMPAYKLNKKPLVYFAAFKNHIGLYARYLGIKFLSIVFWMDAGIWKICFSEGCFVLYENN